MTPRTPPDTPTATPPVPPLWNRNFTLWYLGSAQSALGGAVAGIALSFLVLHTSGSSGAMGVNLALSLLPTLFSPLAGALVDRIPLRVPLMAGNVLRGAIQLAVGLLALRDEITVPALHGAALLMGLVNAFYTPATMGMLPRFVDRTQLPRATGLMQGTTQTLQLVGLVGGGALVGTVGTAPALLADGASFLVFAALLAFIRFPARETKTERTSVLADLRGGFRYVRGQTLLLLLPVMALVVNAAIVPMEMLLPAHMTRLGAGAQGFGLFFGALVGGMAAGSFTLSALGNRVKAGPLSVAGFASVGACFALLALSRTPAQMYVLAFLTGTLLAALNMGIGLIFQTRIQPEFFGRVGGLLNMVSTAGQPLVLLALAPLADRTPLHLMFSVAAVLFVLASVIWAAALRRAPEPAAPLAAQSASG